jgi:M6 family metalloprotease-like protein
MTTLNDFGYNKMEGGDARASGVRPLLAILANLTGPTGEMAHDKFVYGERLFGSPFIAQQNDPNLIDYYREMSCGRFTWKAAEPGVVGPLTLSQQDAALALPARRPKIVQLVRDGGLFNFGPYDLSGDCNVTSSELGVIIVDNHSNLAGQADGGSPALTLACASAPAGRLGTLVVGHKFSLTLVAHELLHLYGAEDVYGPWGLGVNLNNKVSLLGPHEMVNDGKEVWHPDPWHKMRLGWAEPRLYDITSAVPPIELVAPGAEDPTGAAILYSPQKAPHEYFMLEFRNPNQRRGRYDRNVASTGIAIWHVVTDPGFSLRRFAWPTNNTTAPANMLWLEGVRPATGGTLRFGQVHEDFERGGNTLWAGGRMTPPLRWIDGTLVGIRLCVRRIDPTSDTAIVDVLPVDIRRQSTSGRLIQSTWGQQGNYELLTTRGSALAHAFRNNDDPVFAWHTAGEMRFGGGNNNHPTAGIVQTVRGVCMLQSTLRGDGVIGNFEAVLWLSSPDGTSHLSLATFDSATRQWGTPTPIEVRGSQITGATGVPAVIQSDYGDYGNTEMLVPEGDKLVHYWRANDDPARPWNRGASIGFAPAETGGASTIARRPLGVALLQSSVKGDGAHGNYEAVVWVRPRIAGAVDAIDWITFDTALRQWSTPRPVLVNGQPIEGVTGTPAIVQSSFGAAGNYEMLVPQGMRLVHYWRNNDVAARPWLSTHVYDFSGRSGDGPSGAIARSPVSVSMLRSSFKGDGTHGNFDAVVRLRSVASDDDEIAFVAFDTGSRQWTPSRPVLVDGQRLTER